RRRAAGGDGGDHDRDLPNGRRRGCSGGGRARQEDLHGQQFPPARRAGNNRHGGVGTVVEASPALRGIPLGYLRMPHVEKGMAVGLFGGSFNPPHAGHALVAEIALRRLRLDQLWWIVTPGNPLKDYRALAPLDERIQLSEALLHDPRIKVTAFEAGRNLRFTADTLSYVR